MFMISVVKFLRKTDALVSTHARIQKTQKKKEHSPEKTRHFDVFTS